MCANSVYFVDLEKTQSVSGGSVGDTAGMRDKGVVTKIRGVFVHSK